MTTPAITKSSPVSIGVGLVLCGALAYQVADTTAIRTKLEILPQMQSDINAIKSMVNTTNGVNMRQDAEIRSLTDRVSRLTERVDKLK